MESQCIRLKLQSGKTETFLNWARSLKDRGEEIRSVLGAAGIQCEMLFLERSPEGDYLVLYTRAKDLTHANAEFLSSDRALDREARRMFQNCCEFMIQRLEPLLEVNL